MISLKLPTEEHWIDLGYEVRVKCRPLDTTIYEAARAKGARIVAEMAEQAEALRNNGMTVEGMPDLTDPDVLIGVNQAVFAQCLAMLSITEWEGISKDDDSGEPAPVTQEGCRQLMRIPAMANNFTVRYLAPMVRVLEEGKGYAPELNGSSARALDTVTAAANAETLALAEGAA